MSFKKQPPKRLTICIDNPTSSSWSSLGAQCGLTTDLVLIAMSGTLETLVIALLQICAVCLVESYGYFMEIPYQNHDGTCTIGGCAWTFHCIRLLQGVSCSGDISKTVAGIHGYPMVHSGIHGYQSSHWRATLKLPKETLRSSIDRLAGSEYIPKFQQLWPFIS